MSFHHGEIDVQDFMYLCTEYTWQEFEVFDLAKGEVVFSGVYGDCPYLGYEVCSWDLDEKNGLSLNIDTKEDA